MDPLSQLEGHLQNTLEELKGSLEKQQSLNTQQHKQQVKSRVTELVEIFVTRDVSKLEHVLDALLDPDDTKKDTLRSIISGGHSNTAKSEGKHMSPEDRHLAETTLKTHSPQKNPHIPHPNFLERMVTKFRPKKEEGNFTPMILPKNQQKYSFSKELGRYVFEDEPLQAQVPVCLPPKREHLHKSQSHTAKKNSEIQDLIAPPSFKKKVKKMANSVVTTINPVEGVKETGLLWLVDRLEQEIRKGFRRVRELAETDRHQLQQDHTCQQETIEVLKESYQLLMSTTSRHPLGNFEVITVQSTEVLEKSMQQVLRETRLRRELQIELQQQREDQRESSLQISRLRVESQTLRQQLQQITDQAQRKDLTLKELSLQRKQTKELISNLTQSLEQKTLLEQALQGLRGLICSTFEYDTFIQSIRHDGGKEFLDKMEEQWQQLISKSTPAGQIMDTLRTFVDHLVSYVKETTVAGEGRKEDILVRSHHNQSAHSETQTKRMRQTILRQNSTLFKLHEENRFNRQTIEGLKSDKASLQEKVSTGEKQKQKEKEKDKHKSTNIGSYGQLEVTSQSLARENGSLRERAKQLQSELSSVKMQTEGLNLTKVISLQHSIPDLVESEKKLESHLTVQLQDQGKEWESQRMTLLQQHGDLLQQIERYHHSIDVLETSRLQLHRQVTDTEDRRLRCQEELEAERLKVMHLQNRIQQLESKSRIESQRCKIPM